MLTMSEHAQPAPSCIMVIFGAGGDLTHRKLIPALYYLASDELLPKQFAIVAVVQCRSSQAASPIPAKAAGPT